MSHIDQTQRKLMNNVTFSKDQLVVIFEPFIDRLVNECGNDRQAMIDYHITKLVDVPYIQLIKKMPRGPRGRWYNLMVDIREHLKSIAELTVDSVTQ